MIDPEKIPQYNGDLEQLEAAATGLKGNGSDIAATGAAIHSTFQGLSAFYDAPEAEQLFATTKPVADTAKTFGNDVGQVAKALSDYATEIRPIATKLKQLKADATTFVDSVKGSDDWKYDGHKVARNNDLLHQVDVAVAAFWDAERRAANKIDAIFHGTQYVTGDGSNKSNMYGYTADTLDHAKLPWGSSEQQAHHWYDFGHWIKSFVWDGMIVDGLWGTVKGLGGLVGFEGWDTFKNSWTGLADVVGGLGLYLVKPYDMLIGAVLGNKPDSPGEAREKAAFRNFGKSLLAWDEWGKNPARAAGTVAFNVLTFAAGPLSKLGAASKVGEAGEAAGAASTTAKIAGTLGKTGELIDPMTYLTKGVAKLPRISDIAAHLDKFKTGDIKGIDDLTKLHGTDLPEGSLKLPDNTVLHTDLPSHAHAPAGTNVAHDASHSLDTGPGHGSRTPTHSSTDPGSRDLVNASAHNTDGVHNPPDSGHGANGPTSSHAHQLGEPSTPGDHTNPPGGHGPGDGQPSGDWAGGHEGYQYNMVKNPGPLAEMPGKPALNFAGGRYNEVTLSHAETFYRAGVSDRPFGQWFTRQPPSSVTHVRIDTAVLPQWIDPSTGALTGESPLDTVYRIQFPAGTKIYPGPVANQGGVYVGGVEQIFIPEPWKIQGAEVLGSEPLQ